MTYEQAKFLDRQHRKYYNKLWSYVYRRVGEVDLTESVIQQVFLIACVRIEAIRDHPNLIGWLYKTAQYVLEHEKERPYLDFEVPEENMDQYIARDAGAAIRELLPDALSDKDREILLLKFEKNMDHPDIAEYYGISESASRKRLSRALKNCRKFCAKEKI